MPASRFILTAAVLALGLTPAAAQPNANSPVNKSLVKTFQAIYDKMNVDYAHKDLSGFMAVYDPHYMCFDQSGKPENMAQNRQATMSAFANDRYIVASTTIKSARPWKSGVVVILTSWVRYETTDRVGGQPLYIRAKETDEDYWIKSAGAWRQRQEDVLSLSTWEDGQQIQ